MKKHILTSLFIIALVYLLGVMATFNFNPFLWDSIIIKVNLMGLLVLLLYANAIVYLSDNY